MLATLGNLQTKDLFKVTNRQITAFNKLISAGKEHETHIVPTILLPQWSAWAAVQLPCSGSPGSSLRQRHCAMWCTHQRSGRRQCPQGKAGVAMEGPSRRSVHHILDQPQPRPPPPPSLTWLPASNHSTPLGSRPIRSRLVAKRSAWKAWPSSYVPTLNQLDTDKTSILSTKDWIKLPLKLRRWKLLPTSTQPVKYPVDPSTPRKVSTSYITHWANRQPGLPQRFKAQMIMSGNLTLLPGNLPEIPIVNTSIHSWWNVPPNH